ncbi:MAG: hypothetical protein GC179_00785 [Anaerolineaceae bacterium]|nr:hypothetical protein [Anaerolineaceae bacterium]
MTPQNHLNLPSVPLSLRASVLKGFVYWRLPPTLPLGRYCKLHSGGLTRAIRCNCVISAASAEPAAGTKCRFSALLSQIRLPFQRKIVQIANLSHFEFS